MLGKNNYKDSAKNMYQEPSHAVHTLYAWL